MRDTRKKIKSHVTAAKGMNQMLITCPECSKQISDKAVSCPNCGYPLQEQLVQIPPKTQKRKTRMRLPNGFGRITEIKGRNLRNPFRVMVTDGIDENGHPIGKLLKPKAYFRTYNEAYQALVEYNKNPYDYANDITMNELYEAWFNVHSEKVTSGRKYSIKASWDYCKDIIGDSIVQLVRTPDIKRLLDNPYKFDMNGNKKYPSENTKSNMKITLALMFDYAVEYGYTDKNYVRDIRTGYGDSNAEKPHISYTKEEMNILWANVGKNVFVDMILIQCYMGWRPDELCHLALNHINMNDWTIIGGSKTAAGRDRVCAVHEYIRPLIQKHYEASIAVNKEFLFLNGKRNVNYESLKLRFKDTVKELGISLDHRPHDGRKQFVTMAKEAGMDEYAIKKMVGHRISDITERIYTDRDVKWLHSEVAKIDKERFKKK